MEIIQIVSSLVPEAGGPARSVPLLSRSLADQGINVHLAAFDLGGKYSRPLIPGHPDVQTTVLPAELRLGLRPILSSQLSSYLRDRISVQNQVIVHVHGIWLPYLGTASRIADRSGVSLVISPRGMLTAWSLQHRSLRKQAAWRIYQRRWLGRADLLHATSDGEAAQFRKLGLQQPITVIPNGTVLPENQTRRKHTPFTMLFLSRINPKKGLLMLLEALGSLKNENWNLIIAGYNEDNYQQVVQQAVIDQELSDRVSFKGPVDDQHKWDVYGDADLFILPSHSENFGIVVAEALAAGLPVITTTGTPWQDLELHDCGWWVDPTPREIRRAVLEAIQLPDQELESMGRRGRELAAEKYSWKSAAGELLECYRWLLEDHRPVPGSVKMGNG